MVESLVITVLRDCLVYANRLSHWLGQSVSQSVFCCCCLATHQIEWGGYECECKWMGLDAQTEMLQYHRGHTDWWKRWKSIVVENYWAVMYVDVITSTTKKTYLSKHLRESKILLPAEEMVMQRWWWWRCAAVISTGKQKEKENEEKWAHHFGRKKIINKSLTTLTSTERFQRALVLLQTSVALWANLCKNAMGLTWD